MTATALLTFVGVVVLAYVTPGPDWFVVMRNAARSRRAGWISGLGISCGLLVHMSAAAVGIAGLLLSSAEAFTALKVVGAAYLVYLGVRSIMSAHRGVIDSGTATDRIEPSGCKVLRQSFLANVLNPKTAVFFVAILPQFIVPGPAVALQVLRLGMITIAVGLLWWFIFVIGIARIQALVNADRGRRVIDRLSGVALIALGGVLVFVKPAARAG